MHSLQRKVLRTICPDQKGLIARITNICYKHELNIVQNNEFVDHRTGRFFMRTELEGKLMIRNSCTAADEGGWSDYCI